MMRDARINAIGEGANDVLRAFIAVVGMRGVGEELKGVLTALKHPFQKFGALLRFGQSQMAARFTTPTIPVQSPELRRPARELAARVRDFGLQVQNVLARYRRLAGSDDELKLMEVVLKHQYPQERLADAASDLFTSSCTLSRLDHLLKHQNSHPEERARQIQSGRYFMALANRRIKQNLAALWDNDDEMTTRTADLFFS
jgi:hypothetical protein